MKTFIRFLFSFALLFFLLNGCKQTQNSIDNSKVAKKILELKSGTNAQDVVKYFGIPPLWGNIHDDTNFLNNNSKLRIYSIDTSWQTTGGISPLKINDELDWVYLKSGKADFFTPDNVIILKFEKLKLKEILTGSLWMIEDP